jgi:hypothetical protein
MAPICYRLQTYPEFPWGVAKGLSLQDAKSREDLFDELKFDRARPEEAEAEATRRGWPPLAAIPPASAFDPMAEQYWTLPMAMTWIATRSVDAVRMAWNKYRTQHHVWRRADWREGPGGAVHKGWLLDSLEPATSLGIQLYSILGHFEGQEGFMSVPEARKALWIALQEGLFQATGLARLGGGRVPIQAEDWHSLEPRSIEHRDEVGREGVGLDYAEPLVTAKAIWHRWPARREPMQLPPLMTPEGDGYMPLYCAARWIASLGGAREFDPEDSAIWAEAFGEVLTAISSEKVRVVGLRQGQKELVPGHKFAGVQVDYPHGDKPLDLVGSNEVYLRSNPYLDDQHWRHGFDDSLVNRHGELWTQLMVEKDDVRDRWPFDFTDQERTGLPGRPKLAADIIRDELERRGAAGQLDRTVTEQAEALVAWLAREHPSKARPSPRTVENYIRQRYHQLRPTK